MTMPKLNMPPLSRGRTKIIGKWCVSFTINICHEYLLITTHEDQLFYECLLSRGFHLTFDQNYTF